MAETRPDLSTSELADTFASRRYFRKFGAITQHLARVAGVMEAEGRLDKREVAVLTRYVTQIGFTFRALSMKYLMSGRDGGQMFPPMQIDRGESGFPVFHELLLMANDAMQSGRHLTSLPKPRALKEQMLQRIIGARELPSKLQFALSQRLYYEELAKGDLFWARNDPEALWLGNVTDKRRRYLLHWAVYDSQINLPTIYLMEIEDSGRTPLPKDERRWPEVQAHLMGQSMGALKLLTIATGFDQYFNDLHPKRLRRFHVGPMYSHNFTRQTGPLREVLADAASPEGQDWALSWTLEELESERVTAEKVGWFTTAEREVFALDPFSGRGVDTGATRTERAIILPERPFQVLAERNPAGFSTVRKFVVSPGGRVLSY